MTQILPEQTNQYYEQFRGTGFPNGQNTMGVMSDCVIQYQLSSAQILAINTTPVVIVPNPITSLLGNLVPPNGYLFVPEMVTAEYIFGGTAYTANGTNPALVIQYTGQATTLLSILGTGLLTAAVNTQVTIPQSAAGNLALSASANLGFQVNIGGTVSPSFTLGNGTCVLTLLYNIVCLF
jgi:hypothetical protein